MWCPKRCVDRKMIYRGVLLVNVSTTLSKHGLFYKIYDLHDYSFVFGAIDYKHTGPERWVLEEN